MKKNIMLVILLLMIGFNTWIAVVSFCQTKWFSFGFNVGWCLWWLLKMIQLAFERWEE